MELKMYSVRDAKGETYSPPFLAKTPGEAERMFNNEVHNEKSQISKYPEDFDLYQLGTYDDVTGKIKPLDAPQHVVKAINLLKS